MSKVISQFRNEIVDGSEDYRLASHLADESVKDRFDSDFSWNVHDSVTLAGWSFGRFGDFLEPPLVLRAFGLEVGVVVKVSTISAAFFSMKSAMVSSRIPRILVSLQLFRIYFRSCF